jgi:hypothetical protein
MHPLVFFAISDQDRARDLEERNLAHRRAEAVADRKWADAIRAWAAKPAVSSSDRPRRATVGCATA